MNISQNGIDFIQGFEGLSLTAYKAVESEPYYTIGYGHYGADVRKDKRISKLEADQLFRQDIRKYADAVDKYVWVDLNQNQFDALTSLCYNIGIGAFGNSTLLKKLNRKDYEGASQEFERWNKSSGVVLKGLVKRRKAEKELFLKPVSTLVVDGILGVKTIKALQKELKVKPDGIIGEQTVKALQKNVGSKVDGVMGENTIKALQKKVGAVADGIIGKQTIKALQKQLNK